MLIDKWSIKGDYVLLLGHDTTSSALTWCLYEIGRHPEVQESLFTEIQATDAQDSEDKPLAEKLTYLTHLDSVVKECFRIHNPAPEFSRRVATVGAL